ncbi:Osmoprotection protein (proW-1) [Palaeococcus pacificus DY20341]|uniref:Osmoprotection protein (ProW-1) n=1 Tax=Palaeococcus pacificus DY20341 TaxID=1343739 RepID=A0A075LTS9_9EURY|nr:ABC transporter permease [Palaeococcus pacificus]AIF69526.1 Osmoprotection protein (proW-1) [Palaeococcus pacificus DY20341]
MVAIENILGATWEHLILTYSALFISIGVGIPLALISLRSRKIASFIIAFANLVQAIPSLAVVAIVVPLLGIGFTPAVFAIFLRALLPIVKNTYIGLSKVDESMIDAAKGLGLTEWQIIRHIRFPHAYPAMFAGIKFAAILANSIAILTAIIGSGGLGSLVFEGLASFNMDKILAGALPAIVLAILIDVSFTVIERKITPEALK